MTFGGLFRRCGHTLCPSPLICFSFRCGMASPNAAGEYIQFPCDLPQWERITHILTELRDNLCIEPSPSLLVKQLNFIHQLVQDPDACTHPDRGEKKKKGLIAFTTGLLPCHCS